MDVHSDNRSLTVQPLPASGRYSEWLLWKGRGAMPIGTLDDVARGTRLVMQPHSETVGSPCKCRPPITIQNTHIMNKATHQVIHSLSFGGCAIVPAHVAAKFAQEFRRAGDEPDMFGYFLQKGSSRVTILMCRHADYDKFSRTESDYIEIGTPLRANTWRNYV
jgi:hypothetical protein